MYQENFQTLICDKGPKKFLSTHFEIDLIDMMKKFMWVLI